MTTSDAPNDRAPTPDVELVDDERQAILARRSRFVAAAVVSLTGAAFVNCAACLSPSDPDVAAAMYFSSKYDSEALFYRATHDEMTGLANRALYIDRLRSVLARHHREKRPAGVLMIEMDGLKQLNDTFGHRVGDAAIKQMARRLQACARETDTVARLGGDEFGVILSPVEMPEGGEVTIQRIQKEIVPPLLFDGREFPLRASIGAAAFPDDGVDIESTAPHRRPAHVPDCGS